MSWLSNLISGKGSKPKATQTRYEYAMPTPSRFQTPTLNTLQYVPTAFSRALFDKMDELAICKTCLNTLISATTATEGRCQFIKESRVPATKQEKILRLLRHSFYNLGTQSGNLDWRGIERNNALSYKYGYIVNEIEWSAPEELDGYIVPKAIRVLPQMSLDTSSLGSTPTTPFDFDSTGQNITKVTQNRGRYTGETSWSGQELDKNLLIHVHNYADGGWHGRSRYELAYKYYFSHTQQDLYANLFGEAKQLPRQVLISESDGYLSDEKKAEILDSIANPDPLAPIYLNKARLEVVDSKNPDVIAFQDFIRGANEQDICSQMGVPYSMIRETQAKSDVGVRNVKDTWINTEVKGLCEEWNSTVNRLIRRIIDINFDHVTDYPYYTRDMVGAKDLRNVMPIILAGFQYQFLNKEKLPEMMEEYGIKSDFVLKDYQVSQNAGISGQPDFSKTPPEKQESDEPQNPNGSDTATIGRTLQTERRD